MPLNAINFSLSILCIFSPTGDRKHEFGKQQQQQFPAEGSNQTPVKDMEKYSFV
jgi:hypothetical protein